MSDEIVRDHLYERLFRPWALPKAEWPLCPQDWARVDAITALSWSGRVLDVGSGDGTLAAMIASRNPNVSEIVCVEPDWDQQTRIIDLWMATGWPLNTIDTMDRADAGPYDCLLCAEVIEHTDEDEALALLARARKLLKPGALCCVTVPHCKGSRADYPGHVRRFDSAILRNELEAAGLDVEWISGIDGIWLMAVAHAV
jgi:2-polyprenyl-3-methyl-5-hydroxy-6-metoxy-1,4-benzoquinol methylase